jgi:hypothetical protein
MPSLALLGSIALLLSAAQDAGPAPDQSGSPSPRASALPQRPDCRTPSNYCICPWKDVLGPKDFSVLDEGDIPKKVVHCHWQSYCEWRVFADGSDLAIYQGGPRRDAVPVVAGKSADPAPWDDSDALGSRYVVEVKDGWIVALDRGEFGGGIWWVSKDGSRYQTLGHANVAELVKTKVGVLAATGLDHGINGHGEVLLIKQNARGRWRAKHFASIGASAYAATLTPDGYVLVVTRTSLVRVDLDGRTRVLHQGKWDAFFDTGQQTSSFFYPNSMAVTPNGDVFIGMRAVVVHLTPQARGYSEEWLVPSTCPAPNEPPRSPPP